jgi:hypothetical protein
MRLWRNRADGESRQAVRFRRQEEDMDKASWILAGAAAALIAVAPAQAQRGHRGPPTFGSGGHHPAPGRPALRNSRLGHGSRCGTSNGACYDGPFLDLWGYGGLIEDPEYAMRDQGFFSGPAEVQAGHGGAYYDYDRAYPYDWYHDPVAAAPARAPSMAAPAVRCDVSWVAASGGERAPVRVCRGR